MRNQQLTLLLLTLVFAATLRAQKEDWREIQKIPPGTMVLVITAQQEALCTVQKVTDQQLFCRSGSSGSHNPKSANDLIFNRADIQHVDTGDRIKSDLYDYSKGFLSLLVAFGGGTALNPGQQPDVFGGIKIGGPAALDLQYDLVQGHSGFSVEGSGVLPLFRIPRFAPFKEKKFLKVFAEPGMGYRAGSGTTGEYASAKVLLVLLDDKWLDGELFPYVELQRRFPLDSPLTGDTRVVFGVMWALCAHCGVD